jgi:Cu+-exporting ATPase
MALSSPSVVTNANRPLPFSPAPVLAGAPKVSTTDPVVELGSDHNEEESPMNHHHDHGGSAQTFTDPVCGMTVDPATAAATREHDGVTFYFCSPGCATAFDADPHRYGHPHGSH